MKAWKPITILTIIVYLPFFLAAEALPGWEHFSDGELNSGVLLEGNHITYNSPRSADLDLNPDNGLESVFVTSNAVVNVLSSEGNVLWSSELPNHNCSELTETNKAFSAPAITDLTSDGTLEIVLGYGGIGGKECGGGVVAFDAATGAEVWHFDLVDFANKRGFPVPGFHSVYSSPAVKDIDGDGNVEIAFGSFDRNVYVINYKGKVVWYYHAADTVWSSPTWADIDSDGRYELLVGTDITGNEFLNPPTKDGGYLYAFKVKVKKKRKIRRCKKKRKQCRALGGTDCKKCEKIKFHNFQDPKAYKWRTHFDQVIFSSPSVGELNPSNEGLEVAIGSGCFFPQSERLKNGRWVKVLSLATGEVLETLDTDVCITASPAIADIDEDGLNEIVITQVGHRSVGGGGRSKVIAFNPEEATKLWEVTPYVIDHNDVWAGHFASASIADLDNNGSLEIAVAHFNDVVILEGKTGSQLSCSDISCADGSNRLETDGLVRGTPQIADINNDGILDLLIGSRSRISDGYQGSAFAWTNLGNMIESNDGIHPLGHVPWAAFKHNSSGNAVQ